MAGISTQDGIPSAGITWRPTAPYLGQLSSTGPVLGLEPLAADLTSTDGVVPTANQALTGGTWTTGTAPISAAHHLQPTDPSAITQILLQVNAWAAPDSNRAVLLLGPAFSDHTIWNTLLTTAETAHPGITNPTAASVLVEKLSPHVNANVLSVLVTGITSTKTHETIGDGTGYIPILDITRLGALTMRASTGHASELMQFLQNP